MAACSWLMRIAPSWPRPDATGTSPPASSSAFTSSCSYPGRMPACDGGTHADAHHELERLGGEHVAVVEEPA